MASGNFNGNQVSLQIYDPSLTPSALIGNYPAVTVVPGTATFPNIGSGSAYIVNATISLTGNDVEFAYPPSEEGQPFGNGSFNGYIFQTSASTPVITGATLVSSNIAGLNASDLSFTGHTVGLNVAGLRLPNGTPAETDIAVNFAVPPTLTVTDTTTNQPVAAAPTAYSGPVSGVQSEYINVTPDSLNITSGSPSWFIHSGAGTDAIDVSKGVGTNVLDGSTGSNFLTGGSGTDTFFVDDRNAAADIWDTVSGFHGGDAATIWGVTPGGFGIAWADGQGAAGFTGLTLHATAAGKPTASLTLAGYSTADLSDGRLSVSYGTDPSSGSPYMYLQGH
jgi:hypothetical protein